MDPNDFIAEIYKRMDKLSPAYTDSIDPEIFINNDFARKAVKQMEFILPKNKDKKILDIGFGIGQFSSACIQLGYSNVYCADFGAKHKLAKVCLEYPEIKGVFNIESSIGDFLGESEEKYDFIHMAHVIEHIPKHSLLYLVDSIYKSLNREGILFARTPNMLGPNALQGLFKTLGHEYGFTEDNLNSLLVICGFEKIQFHNLDLNDSLKQKLGNIFRRLFYLKENFKYRIFQGAYPLQIGNELIVSAKRIDAPELFDKKLR